MTQRLNRSQPEIQGVSSAAIFQFVDEAEKRLHDIHSFMLVRHGQVIAEGCWQPYTLERPHMLFSLSKSFTSTAIGLAVADGKLSLDDAVISFFPEQMPVKVSGNLAGMCIRHLLSMSTGHAKDTVDRLILSRDGDWVKQFLSLPVKYTPGTHFVYNSGASYMLSAILQKVTGKTLLEFLQPRLFEPLGIIGATWESCPRGINTGGWGLKIRTEDIACFGQMYLQNGAWNGQQIVPQAWIVQAASKQISNGSKPESDWEQGYGYQFWRCRHAAFRGDGAFGQYCIVMPEQDAVLAMMSGLQDMQEPLNLVWDYLLPGMSASPLPSMSETRLTEKLASLSIPAPVCLGASDLSQEVNGHKYTFSKNKLKVESAVFEFNREHASLELQIDGVTQKIAAGTNQWSKGKAVLFMPNEQTVVGSGVWKAENVFEITLRFVETPFVYTLTSTFSGKNLEMAVKVNVGFDPRPLPTLRGKR
jgi:CubicO group peptidase (beta-lactamase class C family)